ncbi:hypothetical protein SAMN05216488_2352 [Microbacterium sp. LKL04]|uniref:hypothetical protein n=1 Tax=unclassified Microbacterium TaxID=2609290 RepID=UPI000875C9D0|nr:MULTISPECIES: hypothetical protein [unclassified Microbacterium]MDQ1125903.1 hypothetical protein [Microbacterium sp. SORGH_AS_0505]SCY57071.1 hypothetical protein SAMN05216488_2352 [Microbacterium sp. LKL04]
MSDVVAPSPYLWGAPLEERLAALDQALALLQIAEAQALQLLDQVRRLAPVVDWSATAADAFRAAVSAWEDEIARLTASIPSVIDQTRSDRQWMQAVG